MAIYLQDDFNRANSATVPGPPVVGGPYTASVGTWGVNGNALYTSVATSGSVLTAPAAADIDVSATNTVLGATSQGLLFRVLDATNFWYWGISSGTVILQRRVAGVAVNLFSAVGGAAGDTFRAIAKGDDIWVYYNGKHVIHINDPQFNTQNKVGFWVNSTTAARWDNVLAQDPPTDPTFGVDGSTAGLASISLLETDLDPRDGFLYKGRDTAALDLAGDA